MPHSAVYLREDEGRTILLWGLGKDQIFESAQVPVRQQEEGNRFSKGFSMLGECGGLLEIRPIPLGTLENLALTFGQVCSKGTCSME